ncbi:MAG: hypothetical protein KC503_35590 [Myxococcales bacterium]|nr:hypothetical protein [Myxococcales bacterium]
MRRQHFAPTALAAMLGFLSAPAWAQPSDEPGLGAPPAPPVATPAPASPASSAPQASPASQPSARLAARTNAVRALGLSRDAQLLARAEASCQAGKPCRQWSALVRLAFDRTYAPRALGLLGRLGDPRAVPLVAQAAAYGSSDRGRIAARLALVELARRPSSQIAVARIATDADDSAVRAAANAALVTLGAAVRSEALRSARTRITADGLRRSVTPDGAVVERHPGRTRLGFGATARGRRKGEWGYTIIDLAYHEAEYGVTDWLEAGLATAVPVGFISFIAHVKISKALSDNVHLALDVRGGFWAPYVGDSDKFRLGAYGGGPILTATAGRLTVNAAVPVYGVTMSRERFDGREYFNTLLVAPNIGLSLRLTQSGSVSLFAEYHMLLSPSFGDLNGRLGAALYGVRLKGKKMYGDLGFFMPVFPDTDELVKFLPVGIPLLSMGYCW